jgi:hypothetical protein
MLKFSYEFDLKNSAEKMSIFRLHSEFKLVTSRSNINRPQKQIKGNLSKMKSILIVPKDGSSKY